MMNEIMVKIMKEWCEMMQEGGYWVTKDNKLAEYT